METEQQSLELDSDNESASPWFLEIRRRNLIRFLAGGVIGPRHVIAKYRSGDILGLCDVSVLLFKDGLTVSELDGLAEESETRDIAVLVEIDGKFAEENFSAEYLCNESKDLMQMPWVMPINAVSKVHFLSKQDLEDFTARQFENVPADKLSTVVSPDLFSHKRDVSVKEQVGALETDAAVQIDKLVSSARLADRLIGGLTMLAHTLPGQNSWVNAFTGLLELLPECLSDLDDEQAGESKVLSKFNDAFLKSVGEMTGTAGDSFDESLYLSAMLAIMESDINEGWNPVEFLTKIVAHVDEQNIEDPDSGQKKWHEFCLRVLRNEIEVPRSAFTDDGDVIRRAVFLLLLRPEPDAIAASMQSGLKVGTSVRALAALLCGMRIGFEGLSNSYKSERSRYEGMSELKTWLLNALWAEKTEEAEYQQATPEISTKRESYRSAGLVGRARISVNGFEIAEVLLELPAALREVWNRAESVGLQIEFDEEHERLVIQNEDDGVPPCAVFVSDLAWSGQDRLVRFWAPCLDVSTATGLRKLTKDKAVSLLRENGMPSTHARFALDENRGAIIAAVDQVAETMQKEELRSHLSSVLRLVHWFESDA